MNYVTLMKKQESMASEKENKQVSLLKQSSLLKEMLHAMRTTHTPYALMQQVNHYCDKAKELGI